MAGRRRRLRWLALGGSLITAAVALAASPAALAFDVAPVPDELRAHPVAPSFIAQPRDPRVTSDGLTSTDQPDYGNTAPVGDPIRDALNTDADAAGTEIRDKAAALAPGDDAAQEALRRCIQNALWDMLFDAGWDTANGASFDLGSEVNMTASRAAGCMADYFHVGPLAADAAADWMMESVINHGADVLARDPSAAAFVNWAVVMAWYSI
jgi:hypothetical protein